MKHNSIVTWLAVVSIGLFAGIETVQAAIQSEADRLREEKSRSAREEYKQKQFEESARKEADAVLAGIRSEILRAGKKPMATPELLPQTPEDVRLFMSTVLSNQEKQAVSCIEQLRNQVRTLVYKRQTEKNSASSPDMEKLKGSIESLKQRLVTLLSDPFAEPPFLPDAPLQKGMIGRMKYKFRIQQVIGSDKALGGRFWSVPRNVTRSIDGTMTRGSTYESVRPDDHTDLVILKGLSTEGMADGQSVPVAGLLKVTGTETYTSVTGAQKTVFVLEPFDLKQFIKK